MFEGLSPADALHLISNSNSPAAQLQLLKCHGSVPPSLACFLQRLATLPLPRQPIPAAPPKDLAAQRAGAEDVWCGFKVGEVNAKYTYSII